MNHNTGEKILQIFITCVFIHAFILHTDYGYASETGTSPSPIKISVKEKGMFSVSYADIKSAGWEPNTLDPKKFQLKNRGDNVPILFFGEEDHSFDPGDYFIFFGEPVESDMTHGNTQTKFILKNVYWLYPSWDDAVRIEQIQKSPSTAESLQDFKETVRLEQDVIMRGEHIGYYFWENFPDYEDEEREDPTSKNFSTNLPGVNTEKESTLRVKVKGENNNPDLDPDHHAKVVVNDTFSDDVYIEGWSAYLYEGKIPSSVLTDGNNIITIANMLDLGPEEDLIRLDWIEIEYSRYFIAQNDELFFSVDNQTKYSITIDGFDNNDVMIFDITDSLNVTGITGFDISQVTNGYAVTFGDQAEDEKAYIALTSSKFKTPQSIEVDQTSDLKQNTNQADYIMITHEDFYDEIQRLASHRQNDGYEVKIVKIQDIYDEFNHGIMHPQAIKDFIDYAYNQWAPPVPSFVLLVGDGNSDATDRLTLGNKNFIPVKMGGVASDTWFAQISGDDILPDMTLGRLPVKTNEHLKRIIDRIINYEQSSKEEWMRKALFVSGDEGDYPYFLAMNEQLADNYLPFNYKTYFYNRWEENEPSIIYDRINFGKAFTVYSGHGNITTWNGVISTSGFSALESNGKPTFLLTFNCLNGHFSNPLEEGFSEEFLRSPGGALACFSPVALGYAFEHQAIAENLFDLLFVDNETVLGPAVMQAKTDAYLDGRISGDTFEQFIFLGDPATKFKICEFYVTEPEDRASISQDTEFKWVADGYSRFILQFSYTPDFSTWQTVPVFTRNNTYSPKPVIWTLLKNMANKNTIVWWRVGGFYSKLRLDDLFDDVEEKAAFTEPLSFTINQ